jgi:alkylation response protein AidB-like acyl-CoA dehydrogenase
MDFVLTEEQQMFQKLFRDFATKEVAKVAEQTDKKEEFPSRLIKRAAGQGFLGVFAPEEPYGGAGLDFTTYTLLVEAMAAECASTALTLHVHNVLALRTLVRHGTEQAKEELVPEMVSGDRIGAFALTESGAGSDPTRLRTVACKEDGHWVITGAKTWVSNAGVAGVYIIFAATDPAAGPKGISAFVVPAETEGVVLGGREKTLGLRGAQIHRLYLKGVRVPQEHLLGQEGGGYRIAMETLDYGRVGISAAAVGGARKAVQLATEYATQRSQFGTSIANKQAIQMYLADAATQVQAGQWLVRHAAWLADQGQPFTHEAAMAKLYCGRMAGEVTNKMLQVHGGAGFIADYPIERHYRDARAMELVEGTSQMQQIIIAANLLGPAGVKVRP